MQTSRALLLATLAAAAACSTANKPPSETVAQCTRCHGDPERAGGTAANPLEAAPPKDLAGQTDTSALGVGAHQTHLAGGVATRSFSLGFTCDQCHPVPTSIAAHPSGAVVFDFTGKLASTDGHAATASTAGSCANYCHDPENLGRTPPAWNAGPGSVTCGSCHDLPPDPSTGHPSVPSALTGCVGCHPATMNADGTLNVAGGKHVNGVVDQVGGHPPGYADPTNPAFHGPEAIRFLQGVTTNTLQCTGCHGADLTGGVGPSCDACHATASAMFPNGASWKTNCTFCHGTPSDDATASVLLAAPPRDVAGNQTGAAVGAHQIHLAGSAIANAFACETCHAIPTGFTIPPATSAHLDGTAEVTPQGAGQASLPASLGTYSAGTCAVYCHGGAAGGPTGGTTATPSWSGASITTCTACHGAPPSTGKHGLHASLFQTNCSYCHPGTTYASATGPAIDPAQKVLHVNGQKDADPSAYGISWSAANNQCTGACHWNGNTWSHSGASWY